MRFRYVVKKIFKFKCLSYCCFFLQALSLFTLSIVIFVECRLFSLWSSCCLLCCLARSLIFHGVSTAHLLLRRSMASTSRFLFLQIKSILVFLLCLKIRLKGCYDFSFFNTVCHLQLFQACLLYTSPSPRDLSTSRMPSSA